MGGWNFWQDLLSKGLETPANSCRDFKFGWCRRQIRSKKGIQCSSLTVFKHNNGIVYK